MKLIHIGIAGTLESCDAQITIEPYDKGELSVDITSPVVNQYGRQIRETVIATLQKLEVNSAKVTVVDRGALDCTLRARVEAAVFRACDQSTDIPWQVL